MMFPDARILVFCKAPVPGQVKTRLIATLGAQAAAELHACLAQRTLLMAADAAVAPVELWCHPVGDPFFEAMGKLFGIPLYEQAGADLGERMMHAIEHALSRSQFALIIGTDCPALRAEHLIDAMGALAAGQDGVIGPAQDGGYVLIGLARPQRSLFTEMPWGTDAVLDETRTRLRAAGLRWCELPALWDVDRPADLARLRDLSACEPMP